MISVVIATFGEARWRQLATERALASVQRQTQPAVGVSLVHGSSLDGARNEGAEQATGEWLCFLDADDELDDHYIERMTTAIDLFAIEGDWLLQPATLGVVDGVEDAAPVVIESKPLLDGNFMVIGTLVRRDQFLRVGGFRPFGCYEDWDLWLRCWTDGAELMAVPDAIYRVHVSPSSRNNPARNTQVAVYNQIRRAHTEAARERYRTSSRRP